MSELKTLKDFMFNNFEDEKKRFSNENLKCIKQEAIKRCKYWRNFKQEEGMLVNWMQIQGRVAELKDLFNLTEEDLK